MEIAKIQVNGVKANRLYCKDIPHGIIGAQVEFEFDSTWQNLRKTVVFRGCCTKDVLDAGDIVTIPAEVVANPGVRLSVGVYGTNADGTLVIPTIWAELGVVRYAADPSGDASTDPALPVWAQIQAAIGKLEDLGTEDKSTLVAAVNEVLEKGGGSGSGAGFVVDDTAPEDKSLLWVDPNDNSTDDFQEAVNTALAQAKASGEFDGADGQPGKDGKDYVLTEADKQAIAELTAQLIDVPTDDHINDLINSALGVIENGTY